MNETIFLKYISKNETKKKLFDKAYEEGQIKEFDQSTITKLRQLYFSCISGLLYLYGQETNDFTIGSKMLLLTHALENEDFVLVHGVTDSSQEIDSSQFQREKSTYNSWIEVKKGNKTWVYDTLSMLMFNKDVYYELENVKVLKTVSKSEILTHPSRKEDNFFKMSDLWLLPEYLPFFEKNIETSPYRDILKTEIMRIKKIANYDDLKLELFKEMWDHKNSQKK